MSISKRNSSHILLTACALALGSSAAHSATFDVYLRAVAFPKTLPTSADGSSTTQVQMWGYSKCDDAAYTLNCTPASSPGPQIDLPADTAAGGSTLRVHLRNDLPDPTSLYIGGQSKALSVHRSGDRVDSFDVQTAPGGNQDYVWPNLRPGTYLYQSGTHVQLQVQMGLYGALVQNAPCVGGLTCAYEGLPFERQKTLIFSEIDPALHSPPTAANATVSGYAPRFFLINGEAWTSSASSPLHSLIDPAPAPGSWVLLRLLNAGLQNRAPQLLGGTFEVLAEDGNKAPAARQQYTTLLPAAKTVDALFTPAGAGTFKIYDRRLGLSNDDAGDGGMQATLSAAGSAVTRPVAPARSYSGTEDTTLSIAAPGLLTGTGANAALLVRKPAKGSVTLNANGAFTYQPSPNANGTDAFTYRVASAGVGSLPGTVTLTIAAMNDAPVANPDVFFVNILAGAFSVPAPGVLANDTDVDGDTLTVFSNTALAGLSLSATGALSFTPGNAVGDFAFDYVARDNGTNNGAPAPLNSNSARVHLVRDLRVTAAVSTSQQNGRWRFSGQVRGFGTPGMSAATRTVQMSFTPSGGCAVAGQTFDLPSVTVATNGSTATFTNNQTTAVSNAQRSGCSAGVLHASLQSLPATASAPAYPAHTVDMQVTIPFP